MHSMLGTSCSPPQGNTNYVTIYNGSGAFMYDAVCVTYAVVPIVVRTAAIHIPVIYVYAQLVQLVIQAAHWLRHAHM